MKKTRFLICSLMLLAIMCGCGNKAEGNEAQANLNLRVGNMARSIKPAMVVLASEMGYYEQEGLQVQFENISSLNDALSAVDSDKLDVLPLGIIPTMNYLCKGSDLVIFGGTISEGGEAVISAENVDKIKGIEDFENKKIAVVQSETSHLYAEYYMIQNNINYEYVILDSMQSVIQAVKKGEADIGWVNSGYGQVAEQEGLTIMMRIGELYPDSVCCRQTTSQNVIKNNREALVKFEIGNLLAYKLYCDDPEKAISVLEKFSGQSKEYVEYCLYSEAMKIDLDPCKERILEFYDVMAELKSVEEGKEDVVSEAIDTTIYKDALDEVIKRFPEDENFKLLYEAYAKNN